MTSSSLTLTSVQDIILSLICPKFPYILMCNSIPCAIVQFNSSFEHHQTNLGHLMHNESRGAEHLAIYIISQPPGHLQTTKNLLCNILSSFLMALRVKGFKHHHFGIRRESIDHKRPIKSIKPFPLSLFSRNNSF